MINLKLIVMMRINRIYAVYVAGRPLHSWRTYTHWSSLNGASVTNANTGST
ncbi:hypothetical protein DPMN_063978 [Dreissena polymorpha]|uniref:Uncharacterized protein n=1 Tax=Dreissena polymorpha TaxID=45954 RepID=A0A9D4CCS5_DREPO|nr:hypothetical protein DPMN_063978 [Dreissena polymorpha]